LESSFILQFRGVLLLLSKAFWKGCKPNFVCVRCRTERIICLSSQYPRLPRFPGRNRRFRRLLFGLAPDGVFRASAIALGAVGSYSTFSPLPRPRKAVAVCSLWHCPSASFETCRPRVSRPKTSCAASRLVEFGLSSPSFHSKRFSTLPKRSQISSSGRFHKKRPGPEGKCGIRSAE